MGKRIHFKVKKDLDVGQQSNVIRLKGRLVSKGYTDIIHIADFDEDFHDNYFEAAAGNIDLARQYIEAFIEEENLSGVVAF